MRIGLNRYYNTISFNYIDEIFSTVYKDIIKATEKRNTEALKELLDFLQFTLITKSFNQSFDGYSKAVTLLVFIYPNLDSSYKKIFIERFFDSLIMKIAFSSENEQINDEYIELSYLPIIHMLKLMLQHEDHESFNYAMSRFEDNFFKIENKKDRNFLHLNFITTLLCWIYFLNSEKAIKYDEYNINYLERNFENIFYERDLIFLNHFFELFDRIEKELLWSVSDWEIKDPKINSVYFVLTPNTWLRYGMIILLLRFEHLIGFNDDLKRIKLNEKFKYLFDDISKILDNNNKEDENIKRIFLKEDESLHSNTLFIARKEKIINAFTFLKKEVEVEYYKKIKSIPLSENKIKEFRNNVGTQWEENTIIFNILKKHNNIDYKDNEFDIKGFGFFQRLQKMKFAFIEGDLAQTIIGLADFGARLARTIDNNFFKTLTDKQSVIKEIEDVLNFIDSIENKENLIIFSNWSQSHKLGNLIYEPNARFPLSNQSFNGIPIMGNFTKFSNYIFIIDFTYIRASIYTSDNPIWFKNQLLVEITESQKETITEDVIKEWNEQDGYRYSENEIDILESNNVNAKILVKFEFIIPKKAKFLIVELP